MLTRQSLLTTLIHATATGQSQHFFDGRHQRRRPVAADYAPLEQPAAPARPEADEPCCQWDDAVQDYVFR